MEVSRRVFLAGAVSVLGIKDLHGSQPDQVPVLDIHQHGNYVGRSEQQLIAHQRALGAATSVLLAGAGWMESKLAGNAACLAERDRHQNEIEVFCSADPQKHDSIQTLQGYLRKGCLGIGELKFPFPIDAPEMHRIYKLAEEHRVPVLIHFQEAKYNSGLARFHKILEAYTKVNFIGHATTWWANVSASVDPNASYPLGPVKRGGLTDRLLADYPNLFGDLSARSGIGALTRDDDFAHDFVSRLKDKLLFGSDCYCRDGRGGGTPFDYCFGTRILERLKQLELDSASYQKIVYENAARLLKRA